MKENDENLEEEEKNGQDEINYSLSIEFSKMVTKLLPGMEGKTPDELDALL